MFINFFFGNISDEIGNCDKLISIVVYLCMWRELFCSYFAPAFAQESGTKKKMSTFMRKNDKKNLKMPLANTFERYVKYS